MYLPACVATAVQKRICESSELKHRTLSKKTTGLSKTFATNFRRESVQRPSNSTVNNEQAVNRVKLNESTISQCAIQTGARVTDESECTRVCCRDAHRRRKLGPLSAGYRQALARTTSTHGTGPSRQRPTLANPEGGGLVRDGPAAQDAGPPLPGGREQGVVHERVHEATTRLLGGISTHGTGPSRQRPTLANPEGGGLVRDGPAAKDAGPPLPGGREQGWCTRA